MLRFNLVLMLMVTMTFINVEDVSAQRTGGGSRGGPSMGGDRSGIGGTRRGSFGRSGFGERIGPGLGGSYSSSKPPHPGRRHGSSRSRHRSDGSSFGIYLGGAEPYLGGGYGSLPSGYAGYYGGPQYEYTVPYGYPVPIAAPAVPPIADAASPLPIVENATTVGRLPKNLLPSMSVVTTGAPDIGRPGTAVLFNPEESGGPVRYLLNGREYAIRPGEAQTVPLNQAWTVEFDRGMNGGAARVTLAEGIHKFAVGKLGWDLVPTQSSSPSATDMTQTFPPAPIPVESLNREDEQEVPLPN